MGSRFAKIAGALVVASLVPALLVAQGRPQTRDGFWFNGGLGVGSAGCDGCDGRLSSVSGGLAVGGTLSPKLLLGAGSNGWSKSEGDETVTVGTLTALIRFYPSAPGGFFLLAGLGLGTVRAENPIDGELSETGSAVILGIGYDIRVGNNVSLTPFWNGFAIHTENTDFNVGQIGLGVTLH